MSVLTDLRTYLLAYPALSVVVDDRIHPNYLPVRETQTLLPTITYHRISTPHVHDIAGAAGVATMRLQISVWASTYGKVEEASTALRLALDGYTGTMGSSNIFSILLDNEADNAEPPSDGSANWIHVRHLDFLITFVESVPSF